MFVSFISGEVSGKGKVSDSVELADMRRIWISCDSINFPIAIYPGQEKGGFLPPVFDTWSVNGAPTYFIIDKNGVVRYAVTGAHAPKKFEQVIAQLLAE